MTAKEWTSKIKYNNQYNKEHYRRITLLLPRDGELVTDLIRRVENLKQNNKDMSLNKYVVDALKRQLILDKEMERCEKLY